MSKLTNIRMVVYYNHYPILTCTPKHLGFLGVFISDVKLAYPAGTKLEVGFIGFDDDYHIDGQRIPMVVNNSSEMGISLLLAEYKFDRLYKWETILSAVLNKKITNTENYHIFKYKYPVKRLQYSNA